MRARFALSLVMAALLTVACAGEEGAEQVTDGPSITVGSANFTESIVLAEIYAQGLESEGYEVSKKLNIGAREVYFPALQEGDIDFLPEYTGSLLSFLTKQKVTASPDSDETLADLEKELPEGVTVMEMAEAQDKDGIVANKETADEHNLTKVSDLKPIASELVLGGPSECPTRQACLKGLEEVYEIEFKEFKALDPSGPQTVTLLESNEIQVANLFTTDARIAEKGFVLLEDDKGIVGAENVLPVVREEIVEAHGVEFEEFVNSITSKLTTEGLTELNKRVDIDKEDADDVAAEWLSDNGLA
jgi:osmoprotectant transport system substrate-binding protein